MIERKMLNMKIKTYFFAQENIQSETSIQFYSHSFIPNSKLKQFETVQMDLQKDETSLLMGMDKTTRGQIRSVIDKELTHIVIENPTKHDLMNFQVFYNQFAKNKKTHVCNSYHLKTMLLLREINGLILSYMRDKEDNIVCYRIYITDGIIAMNLYSASHFRMANTASERRFLSKVNRLLIWRNMLWFKERGNFLYDMGGLTNNENIRRFKMGFGGEIVQVSSGYEAHSNIAKLILKLREWRLVTLSVRGIR